MKIVVGCSMKYRSLAQEVVADLNDLGVTALFPNLNHAVDNKDAAETPDEKKKLAMEHYKAIDDCDVVYLITPQGYMGTSCKLELGYAIASKKPIYFSEPTNDPALDCYAVKFVSTTSLEKFFEIVSMSKTNQSTARSD